MTILKVDNAVGIDKPINEVMDILNYHLNQRLKWNVYIYHKIHKNEMKKGVLPDPQVLKNTTEYIPVFVNDTVNGEIGFIVEDTRKINEGLVSANIFVTFSINIKKINSLFVGNESEAVMMFAKKALSEYSPDLLTTKIKNVYSGFNTDKIIYADRYPFVNFSYRINLNYTDKC